MYKIKTVPIIFDSTFITSIFLFIYFSQNVKILK